MGTLTKRQQEIIATWNPLQINDDGSKCWDGITLKEVRAAYKAARGKCVHDKDSCMFFAVNLKGARKVFEYCHRPNDPARCNTINCEDSWIKASNGMLKWTTSKAKPRTRWEVGEYVGPPEVTRGYRRV
jgi:hypothetical protein